MSDVRDHAIIQDTRRAVELDLNWTESAPGLFSVEPARHPPSWSPSVALQVGKHGMHARAFDRLQAR